MAIFTVTTNADTSDPTDGVLSLREAIDAANATLESDRIIFDPNVFTGGGANRVLLIQGQLVITQGLTIDGDLDDDGMPDITVDANQQSRVLDITAGEVTLQGLTLTNVTLAANVAGLAGGGLAASDNATVTNSTITGNLSNTAGASYSGGGIWHRYGTVTLVDSIVSGNSGREGEKEILTLADRGGFLFANNSIIGNELVDGATRTELGTNQAEAAELIFAETVNFVDANTNGRQDPGEAPLNAGIRAGRVADNGGPVETVALLADPANPALDASIGPNAPATDARGQAAADFPDVDNAGASLRDLGACDRPFFP